MNFKMMQTTFAALLLGAGCAVAYAQPANNNVSPFIVGGKEAKPLSEFYWQVALVDGDDNARNQFCGGTLVAPNWVMTAAHCVDNFNVALDPKRLDVIAGTLTYDVGGVRSNVDRIFVHPQWRKTAKQYDYDAALLKLATPVTVVAPLKLIAPSGTVDGPPVRVSGWGALSEGGPGSTKLMYVDVPVVTNAVCNEKASYDGLVTEQMFCAGERDGGKDSCQGDSGGPVMRPSQSGTKELVGIVSWGHGCARKLKYGAYTRVSSVSKWAADTMAGN